MTDRWARSFGVTLRGRTRGGQAGMLSATGRGPARGSPAGEIGAPAGARGSLGPGGTVGADGSRCSPPAPLGGRTDPFLCCASGPDHAGLNPSTAHSVRISPLVARVPGLSPVVRRRADRTALDGLCSGTGRSTVGGRFSYRNSYLFFPPADLRFFSQNLRMETFLVYGVFILIMNQRRLLYP